MGQGAGGEKIWLSQNWWRWRHNDEFWCSPASYNMYCLWMFLGMMSLLMSLDDGDSDGLIWNKMIRACWQFGLWCCHRQCSTTCFNPHLKKVLSFEKTHHFPTIVTCTMKNLYFVTIQTFVILIIFFSSSEGSKANRG